MLTNTAAKNAKAKDKDYKLGAGGGLFLLITKAGGKYWKLKYRIDGKEGRYSIGKYPDLSLKDAREKTLDVRKLIDQGIHPKLYDRRVEQQRRTEASNTFRVISEQWLEIKNTQWSKPHANSVKRSLENNVYPEIGDLSIKEIVPSDILQMLRKIEARGAYELTSKVYQRTRAIFRFAVTESIITINPAAELSDALKKAQHKNHNHVSIDELPNLLKAIDTYDGHLVTKYALQLLSLVFVRTGELRTLEWSDVNFEKKIIEIPSDRMKMNHPHIVPLSRQAIEILEELKDFGKQYIFQQQNNPRKPMSENTILFALYRMGYHKRMTGHGFRHVASTQLNEMGYRADLIEKQLAHGDRDKIRAIYNKAKYLDERADMMQAWADYLDTLKSGSKVSNTKTNISA